MSQYRVTVALMAFSVGLLAGCGDRVPYTSVADVPGLTHWHRVYEYRNTSANGGCEDGNDCRAYAVLELPAGSTPEDAVRRLVSGLIDRGWSCASAHTVRQGALRSADGHRFVEFEQVADLVAEDAMGRGFFDDGQGLLDAARRAAHDRPAALAVVAARSTSAEFRQERSPAQGLCTQDAP